mgnify:CR=1 FL=1
MLRHLCLLAAAAAATTTQNATRQLDAYAPAPTDLSRRLKGKRKVPLRPGALPVLLGIDASKALDE